MKNKKKITIKTNTIQRVNQEVNNFISMKSRTDLAEKFSVGSYGFNYVDDIDYNNDVLEQYGY